MELLAQSCLTPRQERDKSNSTRQNGQKVLELRNVMDTLVLKMMVRGFHGEVAVKFSVHDGIIQMIEESIGRKHR